MWDSKKVLNLPMVSIESGYIFTFVLTSGFMAKIRDHDKMLTALILPKNFPTNRYDITEVEIRRNTGENSDLYEELAVIKLKEKNIPPEWRKTEDLESLWFADPKYVRDLPLRDRYYSLELTKRRWKVKATWKTVTSELSIISEGTRSTVDAISFFKEGAW